MPAITQEEWLASLERCEIAAGDGLITSRELADKLGVAQCTAAKWLSQGVREGWVELAAVRRPNFGLPGQRMALIPAYKIRARPGPPNDGA